MNYTYLPPNTTPYNSQRPIILLTTAASSTKTSFLRENPRVALLVHDWVQPRPRRTSLVASDSGNGLEGGQEPSTPTGEARASTLATYLQSLNSSSLSSISTSIDGTARFITPGTEQDLYFRKRHLDNNTFSDPADIYDPSRGAEGGEGQDGEAWLPRQGSTSNLGALRSISGGDERDGPPARGAALAPIQSRGQGGEADQGEDLVMVVVEIIGGKIADWEGQTRNWTVGEAHGAGEGLVNGV
jgi:hypothetical protein